MPHKVTNMHQTLLYCIFLQLFFFMFYLSFIISIVVGSFIVALNALEVADAGGTAALRLAPTESSG